jgi:septal ring factor EnvC (AmiA/AmiB activator)
VGPILRPRSAAGLAALLALLVAPAADTTAVSTPTLDAVIEERQRLERDLARLQGQERSLLGDLERLDIQVRLREAELSTVERTLAATELALTQGQERLVGLEADQAERRRYLGFRLREIYKAGPAQTIARFVAGAGSASSWDGLRYAHWLSERDGEVLAALRGDTERLAAERGALAHAQDRLVAERLAAAQARDAVITSRSERARLLRAVREDQGQRRAAIDELAEAARQLAEVARDAVGSPSEPVLDVRRFRGLLDWPADGPVTAGFGSIVHPRFKTKVPHPGLDIDAPAGSPIRSVFDGEVVYADWMRGYGLTVIVDHGHGLLSVYAHAGRLGVVRGERVRRGQEMGRVGETGSSRGAFLYFELRQDGQPVDPRPWFRASGS